MDPKKFLLFLGPDFVCTSKGQEKSQIKDNMYLSVTVQTRRSHQKIENLTAIAHKGFAMNIPKAIEPLMNQGRLKDTEQFKLQ